MSSIIGFLERMGRDSQLRHATREDLAQALDEAGVEEAMSNTILCGDLALLQTTLHVDRTLCCLVYSPKDDEKEGDEREDDGEDGDDDMEPDSQEEDEGVPRK